MVYENNFETLEFMIENNSELLKIYNIEQFID